MLNSLDDYDDLMHWLDKLEQKDKDPTLRDLCRTDLFFLLWFGLGRADVWNPWILARCKEVQDAPNEYLDLWAREHYKSTIITFALSIQDILSSHGNNPHLKWNGREVTIGIFSVTRPIAKGFLRQIKLELEQNELLKSLFPDILYTDPKAESPKWALACDTPVLTSCGWKRHGDLTMGDKIYGAKGQLITVIGNSGEMEAECLRVVFDDCELIASTEHLWPVEHQFGHTWEESEIRILRTNQLRVGKRTERMLPTPAISGIKLDYLIPPYVLGLWLGDGTAGTNIISTHNDDEDSMLSNLHALGYETYIHRKKPKDNFAMYGVRGLKESLDTLGCLQKKIILGSYLYGSYEDRLSLLQGLMDSDGTCKKPAKNRCAGMCMFSNTNANLADGVFHLAASLGLRPSRISFMPKSVGKKRVHHIYFVGLKSVPPFKSPRKLMLCKDKRHKVGRYLRAIEDIPSVPVNCIKVDAEDSLYLAGRSLVPTHNSEDDGLIVKRKTNPKESTVEAWGIVDGQPTSKHFLICVYDDLVTDKFVTSPEMIEKTNRAWELSINLGTEGGHRRYVGTIYHFNDTYRLMQQREAVKARIYPCTEDGTPGGNPVLKSKEEILMKYRTMGAYTFSAQMLLNPVSDTLMGFKREWIRYYTGTDGHNMNIYILVDPANTKKTTSDYTVFMVLGLSSDDNYYMIDMVRDRLSLTERADMLFKLHRKYKPICKGLQIGYEQYGMQADIQHIQDRQNRENYRFDIYELGGKMPKIDRIKRLQPVFQQHRFYILDSCFKTDYQGRTQDLIDVFLNQEYDAFPVPVHDDMLDCMARILDEDFGAVFPVSVNKEDAYAASESNRGSAWTY